MSSKCYGLYPLLTLLLTGCGAAGPTADSRPRTNGDPPRPATSGAPRRLERDDEITLAQEAAPAPLSSKAGLYVHDSSGLVKVRDSQNGFVCLVDHRIPAAVEPQCLDEEGVRTFLPKFQLVASLRARGTPEPKIRAAVSAAFRSGKLVAPRRPGIIYMMSPRNVVTVDEENGIAVPFPPHLMFYAPNMKSADVGSDGSPTSPVFIVDENTPHALMIVPVPVGGGHAHSHSSSTADSNDRILSAALVVDMAGQQVRDRKGTPDGQAKDQRRRDRNPPMASQDAARQLGVPGVPGPVPRSTRARRPGRQDGAPL